MIENENTIDLIEEKQWSMQNLYNERMINNNIRQLHIL